MVETHDPIIEPVRLDPFREPGMFDELHTFWGALKFIIRFIGNAWGLAVIMTAFNYALYYLQPPDKRDKEAGRGRRAILLFLLGPLIYLFCMGYRSYAAAMLYGFAVGACYPSSDEPTASLGGFMPVPPAVDPANMNDRQAKDKYLEMRHNFFGYSIWGEVRSRCASDEEANGVTGVLLKMDEDKLFKCLSERAVLVHCIGKAAKVYQKRQSSKKKKSRWF